MGRSRRHHYTPQFYLTHFAEPMFGKDLRVFRREKCMWDKTPVTPKGVGWKWDLYSWKNYDGKAVDDFERFLTEKVDTPAAPAMRKAAERYESVNARDRELIALFVGFAMARSPGLMNNCENDYFEKMPDEKRTDLEDVAAMWSEVVKRPMTDRDVVRGGFLDAIIYSAINWRNRILSWQWMFFRTPRDRPLITSDWPVFGRKFGKHEEFGILSFPISSEVALVMSNHSGFGLPPDRLQNVVEMNTERLHKATSFVVCHQESFPGDNILVAWAKGKDQNDNT